MRSSVITTSSVRMLGATTLYFSISILPMNSNSAPSLYIYGRIIPYGRQITTYFDGLSAERATTPTATAIQATAAGAPLLSTHAILNHGRLGGDPPQRPELVRCLDVDCYASPPLRFRTQRRACCTVCVSGAPCNSGTRHSHWSRRYSCTFRWCSRIRGSPYP